MSKKKKKIKKYIFIKLSNFNSAEVYISTRPWNEIFHVLESGCADDDEDMKKYGLIGVGEVFHNRFYDTYYGSATWVRTCYRRQGYGILLYKAMMLAASELAKMNKKRGKVSFSPHEAAGCSTSKSAWRAYRSLYKKKFLRLKKKKKGKATKRDKFVINKLPKNFKAYYIKPEAA